MSCSLWRYTEQCDGQPCCGDCDNCSFEPIELVEPIYCPFCGNKKFEIFPDEERYKKLEKENGKVAIMISCKKCDCEMWEHTFDVKDYWERRNMLVEKWNARHYIINGKCFD